MPTVQRSTTPGIHRAIWHAATEHIESNLDAVLTVPGIARVALTSERQLQRVFAAVGSTTVREHILAVRMGRAAELVLLTDAPMTAVAEQVGYGHASAFIKAFRLHHGVTPSELRRRHRDVAIPPVSSRSV
ncbi:helix-turn-helix transcriptional regulator [Solirubrobacter sp. CPCC 204708]|uniref:Helix-turn-helix transcriptional regulator n=1 Tax=Solirubrobacter deserti TaxID=2282478 RepID=A0ABT4RE80_9ACTN|nr:helix-turn-helix transcriptional regulator [Solirubrobacter deserti]MBE2314623.1 helix-turn-helix transcriptional regulator [Solirubrobacter deserti]MDA0136630.1 helix-turn-helix transcriptional regulator [Solirubrobacter deserti]